MATSYTKERRLSGILICTLCSKKKSGRNPKLLQCFHSFCHSCLVSQRKKQKDKRELNCPVCNSATKVPGNGLDGLKDEIKITALEDMMKRLGDRLVCQGCLPKGLQIVAVVKCITCNRHLCETCYEFHNGSELFEGHDVATELCELHGNKVTNVCTTCCVGLCVDCIFSRIHEEHETAKLEEGLIKVESQVEEDRKYLQSLHKLTKPEGKKEQVTKDDNEILLRKAAESMKHDIDDHVTSMLSKYCPKDQNYSKKNVKGIPSPAQLSRIIGKTEKYKVGRITKLSHRKNELRRNIVRMKEILPMAAGKQSSNLMDRSVFLSGTESHAIATELYNKFSNLSGKNITGAPSLMWEKRSKQIFGLEILDDFSAMVASKDFDHVVRYNTDGKVMGCYPATGSEEDNEVQLMTVQDGKLHVLCEDNETLETIDIDTLQKETRSIIDLPEDLCSMAYHPKNKSYFFTQDRDEKPSRIYTCDEDHFEVVKCSLPAGDIRVFKHDGSFKTAVARHGKGKVMVYDSEGTLLYQIPDASSEGNFSEPCDVAPLDRNSLLVADRERCRISQFSQNNGLIFDVRITRKEDLSAPWLIACKYPYLWVACYTKLCRFKWP